MSQTKVSHIKGTSGQLFLGGSLGSLSTEEAAWKKEVEDSGYGKLALRGHFGKILWGYHEAAEVVSWNVVKQRETWRLRATLGRIHDFRLRQRPLMFMHERPKPQGFWSWGIDRVESIQGHVLVAHLGPPEG